MDILDSDFSYLDRRDVEGAEELFREVVALWPVNGTSRRLF